jgi:hypothetical protein
MEQRKAVEHHVVLRGAVHARRAPCGVQLVAVRVLRELGAPGGAAGVEQRRDATGIGLACPFERCVGLRGEQGVEVERTVRSCFHAPFRSPDRDHVRKRSAAPTQAGHARPDVQLGVRPQRHQHVDPRRVDQLGDVFLAQQVVDGARHAGRLGPPQREVGLGNGRQQKGHARLVTVAQRGERTRRAAHLRHHLRMRPARGRLRRVRAANEGDGRPCGVALRRVFQRVEHVRMRHEVRVRCRLDAPDVFQAADASSDTGADTGAGTGAGAGAGCLCCCSQTRAPGQGARCRASV